jgi:hypothetical protein
MVKIAPAATASPADAMDWPSKRGTAIEITAAGMFADTVMPA